jgi:hypothetical protein
MPGSLPRIFRVSDSPDDIREVEPDDDAPVLPDHAPDDSNDERLWAERPPHWD